MKEKILKKITLLQYISGIKNYKNSIVYIKYIKKVLLNQDELINKRNKKIIPLPKYDDYYNTLKKFILKEPKNSEVIKYFLESNVEIVEEKYDYKSLKSNDVILTCLIKNDIEKIKEFLDYYRTLGIKYFAFIDNNSNDGTFELLRKEKNVNLYRCSDDYSTLKREGWMNRLYSRIGFNKWILCVDSDELFSYINQEKYNIEEFIEKISGKYKRVRSLLLDMYSDGYLFEYKKYDSFQKEYKYFDDNNYWEDNNFRSNMIFGGPRTRLFSTASNVFKCALSKYPLFYYEKGDFQGSSHWSFPYNKNTSDILSVLRHFKFSNSDMKKYEERVIKGNYSNGSYEYKKYYDIIKNKEKVSFYTNNSIMYNNSNDLTSIDIRGKKIKNMF